MNEHAQALGRLGGLARAKHPLARQLNQDAARIRWQKAKMLQHAGNAKFRTITRPIPIVYSLADPTTGEVKYVGVTSNPAQRKRVHSKYRTPTRNPCLEAWLNNLKANNLKPVFTVIRETNLRDMYKHEREEIKARSGLLNML